MNNLMKGSIFIFMLSLILFIYYLNNNTKYYSAIVRPDIAITYKDPSNIMGRFIKEYLYDKNGNVYIYLINL